MRSWRQQKINSQQKFGIIVLLTFIAIVITPTFLPAGNALKVLLSNYGGLGAAIVCVCLACIFKRDDQAFEFGKMVYQGVGWDLIVLLAATMPLCAAMESADTGIVATVLGILGPLVAGLVTVCLSGRSPDPFWSDHAGGAQYGPHHRVHAYTGQLGHELRHPSGALCSDLCDDDADGFHDAGRLCSGSHGLRQYGVDHQ